MRAKPIAAIAVVALSVAGFSSCGDDAGDSPAPEDGTIELDVENTMTTSMDTATAITTGG